ncbi:MAG: hypothetical protein HYY37_06915 [Candidatus Aenigmarchaeota archaeon]|nr:hypothetical protein [Candidatus Aenigmarchaeota archaeon]
MAKRKFRCMRCLKEFSTWNGLAGHSRQHTAKPALVEIKLLQQGKRPELNKVGQEFKGKNRIIVS